MRFVLDAGAFVALERGDAMMWDRLNATRVRGEEPVTHGGVVAQVWRGGQGRQALPARALPKVDILPLDDDLGRKAGVLLARTGTADAIDAAVVAIARPGDRILTSDPDDIDRLVEASHLDIAVVPV